MHVLIQLKLIVPLRVKVGASGTYSLNAVDLVNLPEGMRVVLLDSLTGDSTDLRITPNYSFFISDTTEAPRMHLKVVDNQLLTTLDERNDDGVRIYPNPSKGQFFIDDETVDHDGIMEVYDILGKKVKSVKSRLGENKTQIDVNAKSGVYFIKMRKNHRVISHRLNILK